MAQEYSFTEKERSSLVAPNKVYSSFGRDAINDFMVLHVYDLSGNLIVTKVLGLNEVNFENDGDFIDIQDSTLLYVGSESGDIYKYFIEDPFITNPNDTFVLLASSVGNIFQGFNSFVSIADINNDNKYDIVVGNKNGGLNIYMEDSSTIISVTEIKQEIKIYPNPAKDHLFIQTTDYTS